MLDGWGAVGVQEEDRLSPHVRISWGSQQLLLEEKASEEWTFLCK